LTCRGKRWRLTFYRKKGTGKIVRAYLGEKRKHPGQLTKDKLRDGPGRKRGKAGGEERFVLSKKRATERMGRLNYRLRLKKVEKKNEKDTAVTPISGGILMAGGRKKGESAAERRGSGGKERQVSLPTKNVNTWLF